MLFYPKQSLQFHSAIKQEEQMVSPISSVVFPIILIHSWMTGIYDSVEVSVAWLCLLV